MAKYPDSNGLMIEKSKIDRNVAATKKKYLEQFFDEHRYHFCERTERSDGWIDCSHIVSVDQCQKNAMCELAWDINNLELLCRDEHNKIEVWANSTRLAWYHARLEGMSFENFKLFNGDI